MNENVTESVLVTLRGGVEEGRRFSNEEKDPTTSKELNEEPYEVKISFNIGLRLTVILETNGKKSLAYQIIYRAMKKIQQKTETNPLSVLRQAIRGVTPDIAVKARRVGGSTHQVPIEIGSAQGKALAIRWLLGASRKRPGRNMAFSDLWILKSGDLKITRWGFCFEDCSHL
ncbi:hypothetical protein CMV_022052 [Castanea mollissima]|uniref:Small ribosomal subunit protein uS7 domain-containing protein n=1 Tax=Castanea mollissima TaxID=60419 RepID=A0A8J4QIN5_9ROSI|nr:hypothetical protein CMV_022052 [Castanea mollissima]